MTNWNMDDRKERTRDRRNLLQGILLGAAGALLLCTGAYVTIYGNPFSGTANVLTDPSHVQKLKYLETLIDQYYLEEKDEEKLAEGIYTGLLYGLDDPYSRYYTAKEYKTVSESTEGEYLGIGILMQKAAQGGVEVVECYEGGPCDQAGVKTGDVITRVNDVDISELELGEISDIILEAARQDVILTIARTGEDDLLEIKVSVTDVELHTVSHEMLPDHVGYLSINEFKGVTFKQYESAVADLRSQGMERLIVDLRNNPGGLLSSVCDILGQILPEGRIVYTEDKYGHQEEKYCDGENPLEVPLVVLVNENSASASEIFAGAVKDYGVGKIVGTTTYGKGIVQTVKELTDGSAVKLTISKYYTPDGNNIHQVGIQPDVEVDNPEDAPDQDLQLQTALEVVKSLQAAAADAAS